MIATDYSTCAAYRKCRNTMLCVALLDDLHLSLECDALGVHNNRNPWTENSQKCDFEDGK